VSIINTESEIAFNNKRIINKLYKV